MLRATLFEQRLAELNGQKGEQKEAPGGASRERNRGSAELAIEVMDDALEVGLVEDFFVLGDTQQQGTATKVVDLAGDTLGVVVDSGDETVAEERVAEANDAQMMLDVSGGLFQVEGGEVIADGDALVKRLVGGEAELVDQVGLTEQDEGE